MKAYAICFMCVLLTVGCAGIDSDKKKALLQDLDAMISPPCGVCPADVHLRPRRSLEDKEAAAPYVRVMTTISTVVRDEEAKTYMLEKLNTCIEDLSTIQDASRLRRKNIRNLKLVRAKVKSL